MSDTTLKCQTRSTFAQQNPLVELEILFPPLTGLVKWSVELSDNFTQICRVNQTNIGLNALITLFLVYSCNDIHVTPDEDINHER